VTDKNLHENVAVPCAERGIALRCDREGRVLDILRDAVGADPDIVRGATLARLVDDFSAGKAIAFLRAIAQNGGAFGWELNLALGTRLEPLTFAGFRTNGDTIIVGAGSADASVRCLEDLAAMNMEQSVALRRLLKDSPPRNHNNSAYEELMRLNSELTRVQRDLSKANAELARLASTDELTGVLNRRAFFERAEAIARRAAYEGLPVTVIMFDADHFKKCNDRHGHAVGDRALKSITARITPELRPADCFGRYGGEEFAVVLPGCDEKEGMRVAERIRVSIENAPLTTTDSGVEVRLTLSLGVATTAQAHGEAPSPTLECLLARADRAMYEAKALGRNCAVLWTRQRFADRAA